MKSLSEPATTEYVFVNVRMPADLVIAIDELAIEAVRSRSAQVIYMLRQAIEKGGVDNDAAR